MQIYWYTEQSEGTAGSDVPITGPSALQYVLAAVVCITSDNLQCTFLYWSEPCKTMCCLSWAFHRTTGHWCYSVVCHQTRAIEFLFVLIAGHCLDATNELSHFWHTTFLKMQLFIARVVNPWATAHFRQSDTPGVFLFALNRLPPIAGRAYLSY